MSIPKVLLYVPNLIDYCRLIILYIAWSSIGVPVVFLPLYATQAALDFFDGYFARKLNQTSAFGAWLDVVIDNIGRGLLWIHVHKYGYLIVCVEWLTFSCTQSHGTLWKSIISNTNNAPFIVKKVMEKNFKTQIGFVAIAGLHCLPIWIYMTNSYVISGFIYAFVLPIPFVSYSLFTNLLWTLLVSGRLLCLYVELWIIYKYIEQLIKSK